MSARQQLARNAAEAHTNLTVWGLIISLLEGGGFYGGRPDSAANRIIKICKEQQQKELAIFDSNMGAL